MNNQANFEQFMADVFQPPHQKPENADPYESEEYQKFVESMAEHCHCKESNRPCDGILAGGFCDGIKDDDFDDDYTEDEE